MSGLLHRLAERECMGKAADPRDPLRQNHRVGERASLKTLLNAAMLEEELRVKVDYVLADIEEDQLRRLDDVGAHRPEWQSLDLGAGYLRKAALGRLEGQYRVRGIGGIERRNDWASARMENEAMRFGMTIELNPEKIGDLALVPTEQWADHGEARDGSARHAPPHKEVLTLLAAREIAQLDVAGRRVPGIGHLHAAAAAKQFADCRREIRRLDCRGFDAGNRGICHHGAHGIPGDSEEAIEVR